MFFVLFFFSRQFSIYIKNCQVLYGTGNFKSENKGVTPVELYTKLYSLIPSKFFVVNVITVTGDLY